MKVKELIEALKRIDGELHVFVPGHGSGVCDFIELGGETQVAINVNDVSHVGGRHEADAQDQTSPYPSGTIIVNGIVLD